MFLKRVRSKSWRRNLAVKNLRIPGLVQVLPEGCACAATDRCFLLANCCTPRREAEAASDLPKKERRAERGKRGKISPSFLSFPPPLAPRRPVEPHGSRGGRERKKRFLCRVATSQKEPRGNPARGGGPPPI